MYYCIIRICIYYVFIMYYYRSVDSNAEASASCIIVLYVFVFIICNTVFFIVEPCSKRLAATVLHIQIEYVIFILNMVLRSFPCVSE